MRYNVYKLLVGMLTGIGCLAISTLSQAGVTNSYTLDQQSYAGAQARQYKVYVPADVGFPAPMVMVLHGCQQTHDDVLNDWGMKVKADQEKFILVTPFITRYDGLRNLNCWGFWFDGHMHEGKGEPEDLHRIGLEVESNYNIDPERRYITGLSSGGAMTVIAAITHNEYWAAAAPAAGLAYSETSSSVNFSGCGFSNAIFKSVAASVSAMNQELDDDYVIPMLVLANNNDCTVVSPADSHIRDAHLGVFGGANAQDVACEFFNGNNFNCRHTYYTTDGSTAARSTVETISFSGPVNTTNPADTDHGHYWVGGAAGNEGKWAVKHGPTYPDLVWDFFNRHPRNSQVVGHPVLTLNGDNPLTLKLNDTFTDPGASATDAQDGALTVTADCSAVDTSTEGEYTCNYTAVDSDANTVTASRKVIVRETCAKAVDSPSAHLAEGRVVTGGFFNLYLFTADEVNIGLYFNFWSSVTLTEGEPGLWYSQPPTECNDG